MYVIHCYIVTANSLAISSYQYKYGFSRSMLTELIGSRRNHVVKVNPFSWGHFAKGGRTIAWKFDRIGWENFIILWSWEIHRAKKRIHTDPFRPGKLKNTSGPLRWGIWRRTVSNFAECLGCEGTIMMYTLDRQPNEFVIITFACRLSTYPFSILCLHTSEKKF
jgi:hypothetical protein